MNVQKIYIGSMGEGDEVGRFCMLLEGELTNSKFTVVNSADSADAILSGFLVIRQSQEPVASVTISLKDARGNQIFFEDFGPQHYVFGVHDDTVKNRAQDIARRLSSLRDYSRKSYEKSLKKSANKFGAPSAPAPDAAAARGRGRVMQTDESQARPAPISPNSAPEPTLAPIAPPPPPPTDVPPPTKTISLGQTRAEVLAILGRPQKVVILANKEMLYYPDMKVTLVDQKVADVQ